METKRSSAQNEGHIAFGFVLLFCFSVLLVVLFLFVLDVESFAFLLAMMLAVVVGMIAARHKCPTWQDVVKANWFRQKTGSYIGVTIVFSLLFIIIMGLLNGREEYIFSSATFGALTGVLMGYFLWRIGLYVGRKSKGSAS